MTGGATTKVEGADTARRTLGEAGDKLADMAPPAAGRFIQGQARAHAPFVSGRLRASIEIASKDGEVEVGSSLEYAGVIHNGWAAHNIAANPFLIPVAEDTISIWGEVYETEARRIVATTVKGA